MPALVKPHHLAPLLLAAPILGAAAPPLSSAPASAADIRQSNAWLEIDAQAFAHNLSLIRQGLGKQTQLCAVMKADAYGHGLALLMPTILAQKIPCVGVASNEELRVVRENGFNGRLMRIRSATPGEIKGALPYKTEELLGNAEQAEQAARIAMENGIKLPIHLGLNSSGMSRNGMDLSTDQNRQNAIHIAQNPNFQIVGITTHYPVGERQAVLASLSKFKQDSTWLIAAAGLDRKQITLHTANSFATMEVPASHLDMVRPGRALYGDMGEDKRFRRVLSAFKTRVSSVNPYPANTPVGYDGTHVLNRDSLLANIPVGYSDAYPRRYSNRAHVLINGQRAPIVGRISMNTFMADVTDLKPRPEPGAEVVLFGKQGQAEITQAELEQMYGDFLANLYTVWAHSNYKALKASPENTKQAADDTSSKRFFPRSAP
ncbi:alanine racemase [Chromobacterium sp. Beijing]|uniref:alanine racemase n=1 Tax=Chromobacterium sp. Beijing TaxID=2735795 RepID=UPI001F1C978C|nr:alanine racemase [Chromobacterium sp. Beijing]UJB31291.1 alanine racemase [Chromobacterium sp. Beijing]